ncbi:MAG: hypothetical protein E7644_07450 [Ruminococcaceae bacterium]|nr:hypothetical protein [Oscillospiraceae bacterium]
MELLVPKYVPKFKCIAARCRHNCCIGWEIGIDGETLQKYRTLAGDMGDAIRMGLVEEAGEACFRLDGARRCANLDETGLCRIISELGEGYLCEICREHPRFYHTAGGHEEGGIGASCEEAARLILAEEDYVTMVQPDGKPATFTPQTGVDFDAFSRRCAVYGILADKALSQEVRRKRIREAHGLLRAPEGEALKALLGELEYLYDEHRSLLLAAATAERGAYSTASERFLAYAIFRHASPAECEAEFRCGVSLALLLEELLCRLVNGAGLTPGEAARMLSEELEYSEENTEAVRFALELQNL